MNRRTFLRNAGAAIALSGAVPRFILCEESANPIRATLTVDETQTLATIPSDFIGLSYESAQLANPAFFSSTNTALIRLFRELSANGVLRLGGGTSEFTTFTTQEPSGPPPFDAVGPDTSKNVKADTPITLTSVRNLRAFLDATNWRCLYGLNLGRGTADQAAEEAVYVAKILGPKLIAFQLGNEPDAWRNRYRPASWTYADYWKEWSAAHAAIAARVPKAKFAGPDVSNKIAYVTGFAEDVKKNAQDVILLTSHYYAMGPAGAKDVTLDKLLSPDSKLERDLKIAINAARNAGIPYRMSEGNSCWNGGEPGVSDTLASALWVVDMMLDFASLGCAGVNLHGGGNGYYTPIAGSLAAGFTRRPEYFGMELVKQLVDATVLSSILTCPSDRVRSYALRKSGKRLAIVINKTAQPAEIQLPLHSARRQWLLAGPAIDAKQEVALTEGRATALRNGVLHAAPYSAVLIES
ncbi:MAG TPA: hypothetical protein VHD85_15020 [Terracidiphilus sp.]|nr:hypothetical protein [Terracidiphilus sp.]